MTGSDVVVDYDPSWPDRFEDIRAFVAPAVADVAQAIEHVGSTSVPGLAAKPVIDVDVVVQSRTDIPAAVAALEELGYGHVGDLGRADREAFRSVSWLPRHHLYVVVHGSRPYLDHVQFRDHLRRILRDRSGRLCRGEVRRGDGHSAACSPPRRISRRTTMTLAGEHRTRVS